VVSVTGYFSLMIGVWKKINIYSLPFPYHVRDNQL
jgi:hypothetical protein